VHFNPYGTWGSCTNYSIVLNIQGNELSIITRYRDNVGFISRYVMTIYHVNPDIEMFVCYSTDGRSNRGNLNSAVSAIRGTTIQVYAVGIGNINRDQLRSIASDPDDEHVYILKSFLDAAGFVDFLSVTTCDGKLIMTAMSR